MSLETKITIIHSNRKTLSIELKPNEIIVRAPIRMKEKEIYKFIESKKDWIDKHLAKLNERQKVLDDLKPFTQEEIKQFIAKAKIDIPKRVEFYAEKIGVTYNKITIRSQHTRWGSCSSKGNLNFNCLLTLVPPEGLDYVIVHELCHRLEMNHSQAFWEKVAKTLPDYSQQRKWLKDHGSALIGRL